jgi:hypothetical protein
MSRWVTVGPERLDGWIDRFTAAHGGVAESTVDAEAVRLTAVDGTVAELVVPFPPLRGSLPGDLVAHALADRRVGVLLVRLGGYAAGVFDGSRLVTSKVGSRLVHGRSAAGGQSQQRFARRREGQARQALGAAADTAAAVLLPAVSTLDAVVLGGDRRAVDEVMTDRRLAALRPLVVAARIDVPDPKLKVLQRAPELYRAVRIGLSD